MPILKLQTSIMHYLWGGTDFISNLLGIDNFAQEPFAELWIGAHRQAPCLTYWKGTQIALNQLIRREKDNILGNYTYQKFGKRLPYLLKALDVRQMLSIQVHPNKENAKKGFARENKRNISLSSPLRNYKDNNHKPEIMLALSDFWLLHGFRSIQEIHDILENTPEFETLKPYFLEKNIQNLYKNIMEMPQEQVNAILNPLLSRLKTKKLYKNSPDYWALLADQQHHKNGDHDRGIFSIYLLNLLNLRQGQAIFQDSGILHAYLEGTNIELMANSDNVLRGGLTPKHISVNALLKNTIFEPLEPQIIRSKQLSETEKVFPTSAQDFELSELEIAENQTHQSDYFHAPDSLLVIEGEIEIFTEQKTQTFRKGDAFFVSADQPYQIFGKTKSKIYKATVPIL